MDLAIRDATVADCDAIGLITVAASLGAFVGAIPEEQLDLAWDPAASAAGWRDGFASFTDRGQRFRVAIDEGDVVGWAWSQPWADTDGLDASIRGLYVRPTRHGEGIGRRLVADAAAAFCRDGLRSLEIGCVRENPSCGFYRRLGGVEVGQRPVQVDRFETVEILFGWPDLTVLVAP